MEPVPGPPPRTFKGSVTEEPAELVHHDQAAPATVRVLGHDARDRARRAMLGLGACWGAAILAVFLPLLHFILVPGPLVALSQLKQRVTILDVTGPCPACGNPIHESLMSDSRVPLSLRCEKCRRALTVKLPTRLVEG
jgi:hypothetical protein